MPADPLESRLDHLYGRQAPPAPSGLLAAVARRRRARTAAQVAAAAGLVLLAGSGITVLLRPRPAPSEPGAVAVTAAEHMPPTIAAINATNPDLSPETLRLPEPASGGSSEPLTVRSFRSLGG